MISHKGRVAKFAFAPAVLAIFALAAPEARAGMWLGTASNYGILVEPNAHNVAFSNGTITANIGIGSGLTGQFQNTSGQIIGNVDFAGPANMQNPNPPFVTGSVNSNVSAVTTAINTINSLATTLGGEAGTSVVINIGGGGSQTIDASSGITDADGNKVFTVSGGLNVNSNSDLTGLTINGTSSQNVVINFASLQSLNGAILLTGGLTPDNVLFNYTGGGNFTATSNNHTLSGDFLAVGAKVTWDSVTINGRLFGGANGQDFQINSGFNLVQPQSSPSVPEPSPLIMSSVAALLGLGCAWRRGRRASV